jgi:hypothetical protein
MEFGPFFVYPQLQGRLGRGVEQLSHLHSRNPLVNPERSSSYLQVPSPFPVARICGRRNGNREAQTYAGKEMAGYRRGDMCMIVGQVAPPWAVWVWWSFGCSERLVPRFVEVIDREHGRITKARHAVLKVFTVQDAPLISVNKNPRFQKSDEVHFFRLNSSA